MRTGSGPRRAPLLTREAVEREYARPRSFRLVFTNGVFDILHVGHVYCLEEARRLGDRLVVAVNSDASARRLKGEGRPLQNAEDRARVVAALRPVDAVTVFEEDTPLALIRALRPDVLVKGGDYRAREVVGATEVREAGGIVVTVPLRSGRSTSELLRRARRLPAPRR